MKLLSEIGKFLKEFSYIIRIFVGLFIVGVFLHLMFAGAGGIAQVMSNIF